MERDEGEGRERGRGQGRLAGDSGNRREEDDVGGTHASARGGAAGLWLGCWTARMWLGSPGWARFGPVGLVHLFFCSVSFSFSIFLFSIFQLDLDSVLIQIFTGKFYKSYI